MNVIFIDQKKNTIFEMKKLNFHIMETNNSGTVNEIKTEDFNPKKHLLNATLGSLYYIFLYIPFILPFKIWSKAATRLSLLWEQKTLMYNENKNNYPLILFYFHYIINFLFDAIMFLIWPLGFIWSTYNFDGRYYIDPGTFEGYMYMLLTVYMSVLIVKLQKEILFFIINNLFTWLFDVIKNIGKLIKNAWLLNFVHRDKTNNSI